MPEQEACGARVCVLVPARNEERNLRACVASLVAQSEEGFALGREWWIVLVDDDSTDSTGEIAAEFARENAGVIAMQAPVWKSERHGLTGKNAALWAGVQRDVARSADWLLFTDADTLHEPGSLHRAITEAERHELGMLSYSPRQITRGMLQRALMPLVFSELASVYPPKKVSDPSSPIAAANGQFMLVRREVYFAVGGHRAVADKVLEDVALAQLVKRQHGICLRYAPEAVSARMYDGAVDMFAGWTKNLALLFGNPLFLAANRMLDFCLLFGLPVAMVLLPLTYQKGAAGLLFLRVLFRYYNRVARSNFPLVDLGLSVLALPMFAVLLVRSWQRVKVLKQVEWKGREYRT